MIADQQQYEITSRRLAAFRAAVAEMDAAASAEPMAKVERDAAASWVETLERETAMWEAGIQEEVPEVPQPWSLDLPAGTDTRHIAAAVKRVEIANIDRQVGIALDRIADWRRHRAWLEREIADLEAAPEQAEPVEVVQAARAG